VTVDDHLQVRFLVFCLLLMLGPLLRRHRKGQYRGGRREAQF
jgi:hypothetical protein